MDINLKGTWTVCRAVVSQMKQQEDRYANFNCRTTRQIRSLWLEVMLYINLKPQSWLEVQP